MVRWEDIPEALQGNMKTRTAPFERTPWAEAPKLVDARVAIITTAAIHRRDDRPFTGHEGDYRVIPGDVEYGELAMTHSSVNFDRTAYQQDVNVCLPLEHVRTLVASDDIGSAAGWHYSFMGSTAPQIMEPAAKEVSKLLLGDNVNLVILIPV